MNVRRAEDYRVMPWANGSGATQEVAIWPPTSSLMDFDWRISLAGISRPGPFSALPGVNRILTVIKGGSLELRVATTQANLVRGDQTSFGGEASVEAVAMDSEVQALNVMTRRGRWDAHLRWAKLSCETCCVGSDGQDVVEVVFVVTGQLRACDVTARASKLQLGPLDVLQASARSEIEGTAEVILIRLTRPEHFVVQ